MKASFTFLFLAFIFGASAQLKMKTVEKPSGTITYCYHSNGKISTSEFRPYANSYGSEGNSNAYDKTGKLIYECTTSRSGMLSGVRFSYYENGAVKVAEYSSHPDAGIQWYKKTTYFDENGIITSEFEQSHDDRVTTIQLPDTAYQRLEHERQKLEEQKRLDKLKEERARIIKDSTEFYFRDTTVLEDGTMLIVKPDPANSTREFIYLQNGKLTKQITEFYHKTDGVYSIQRTYYKNGRVHEEKIIEKSMFHYRAYNKRGILVKEMLNQKQ